MTKNSYTLWQMGGNCLKCMYIKINILKRNINNISEEYVIAKVHITNAYNEFCITINLINAYISQVMKILICYGLSEIII